MLYFKKMFALWVLCMLLATGAVFAESRNNITLTFGGVKLSSDIRVTEKNGVRYINLPFLKHLNIGNDWDPSNGNIDLHFGKYNIQMNTGSTKYRSNGQTRYLKYAPFEQDNQIWLPVEFILRLGLVVKKQDWRHLDLDWEHNYLLGIENVKYKERPAFLLVGAHSFKTKGALLGNPNRLVVDVTGVKAHFTLDCRIGEDPVVKNIRFNQTNPTTVRLVFDLDRAVGYKIIPSPDHDNQVYIVFNYLVQDISFFQKDQEHKVYIKTSFPAVYDLKTAVNPNRLIIDFNGATLDGSTNPLPGDGKWISQVRMSQFNPDTVRVVLDLNVNDTAPCFVLHARDNPNLLEIRTIQKIHQVNWFDTEQGGRLTIEADGELVSEISKSTNSDKLQIDLDYSRFEPGLSVPKFRNSYVKEVRLVPVSTTEVRIDLDLNRWTGYDTQLSSDRRKLTINFKKSPLIGKTIIIDPGHGGVDSGACGRQGIREKDVNLEVAMHLKDDLENAGASVVMTRIDDSFIGLYERPFLANFLYADLFVSVHTNTHPDSSVNGIEVWYRQNRSESQTLAKDVLEQIIQTTGFKSLGIKSHRVDDDFVVVREPQMPSILVEVGFLSNFQEESVITTPEFRQKAAAGIFQGVMNYFQK